jgi:hypothetical protein
MESRGAEHFCHNYVNNRHIHHKHWPSLPGGALLQASGWRTRRTQSPNMSQETISKMVIDAQDSSYENRDSRLQTEVLPCVLWNRETSLDAKLGYSGLSVPGARNTGLISAVGWL